MQFDLNRSEPKTRLWQRAVAVTASLGLAATALLPTTVGATPAAQGALNVAFLPKAVNNPYFDTAANGAKKAASELGGQFKQVGPSEATGAAQVPFIQDLTTQKVSAIGVSAADPNAIAPALRAARGAGIKIVGYDSSPAEGAYDVFVNQADTQGIGEALVQMACDEAPDCAGDIAILSATSTATNQNAWIAVMQQTLQQAQYSGLNLVDTVYGNDELGTPNSLKAYVKDGTIKEFALWNVSNLGYLTYYVAAKLVAGEITGAPGQTFSVPNLGDYTIGDKSTIVLGPPQVFKADNIDQFDF